MIGGLVALAISAISTAYAILVIRAAPGRRDNVMFGVLAATDAAMVAWRGINVLAGDSIVDEVVTLPCGVATTALAVVTIEFISAFPRRPPMSWGKRIALWVWAASSMLVLIAVDADREWGRSIAEWTFFAPVELLIFWLAYDAWRNTRDRDARTVIAVIAGRWVFGFAVYFIAPHVGLFEQAVWAETTGAVVISCVLISTTVLRGELFSLRSSTAEATTIATIGCVVLLGGGAAF